MKNYDYEIAIVLKKVMYDNSMVGFVPEKIVEGFFDEESNCFFDFDGTPYYHIIYNPDNYGFCKRLSFKNLKDKKHFIHPSILKSRIFKSFKKFYYLSQVEPNYNVPIISFGNKKYEESILVDSDILKYYYDYHRMFYNYILSKYEMEDIFKDQEEVVKFDINKVYENIKSKIVGQDEQIKKILTVIYQHYNNYDNVILNNLLINGNAGVGKSEIFNLLLKDIDIPSHIISINKSISLDVLNSKICIALEELAKKANYDVEKAQRGILILDGIENIVNSKYIQRGLVNIFNDGGSLKVGDTEYDIDFKKMLIVGIGDFSKIINIGFTNNFFQTNFSKEQLKKYGADSKFIDLFSYLIQMNDLDMNDLKKILSSNDGYLNIIRDLFNKQGIKLNIDEEAILSIAKECIELKKGVKGIDEIINNIMLNINYELASKGEEYSEVVISSDTIKDNNNYKLIKKSLHKD